MIPPYNHTRGDSALTPCPWCAERGRQLARRARVRTVLKRIGIGVALGLVIVAGWTYAILREIQIWTR